MLSLVIAGILFLFLAGCTGTEKPAFSTEGTYPAPPSDIRVEAQMEKNPIDQSISVIFSGGEGQHLVDTIRVVVTHSDGERFDVELNTDKMSEVSIPGTKGSDHVTVLAQYYNGNIYTIAEGDLKTNVRMDRV